MNFRRFGGRGSVLLVILLILSLFAQSAVFAAGGIISGKVTNPVGQPVAEAAVTATDTKTGKTVQGKTDAEGKYRFEGLPAGNYIVTVQARGFTDFKAAPVQLAESEAEVIDAQLEIPGTTETVTVTAGGTLANTNQTYRTIRTGAEAAKITSSATVTDLVFQRDAGIFRLKSGALYFTEPVMGRVTGAVFIGEGQFELTPPTEMEKKSLAIFIQSPKLVENFSSLVLHFTDKTFDEIKASPNVKFNDSAADGGPAKDLYSKNISLLRRRLRSNIDIRTLIDLFDDKRPGYFLAFINGREHSKLLYNTDPLGIQNVSPEQVALISFGENDGGIWTAFHLADSYAKGSGHSGADRRLFDFKSHKIEATIKGTVISATDKVTIMPRSRNLRVIPFDFFPTLRVSHVRNAAGEDVEFIQEKKDEDADFAVILPAAAEMGKPIELTIQYEGNNAIFDSGGGNFILLPQARGNWYPNNGGTQFGDRATFDATFRYSKKLVLVGTGELVEEKEEGDVKVAHWTSGTTELAVSGFNLGGFKKKEVTDPATNYTIEFYANKELPSELRAVQQQIEFAESQGARTETTLGSITTTGMADTALGQGQNSTRIYDTYFGKLPYKRVALSQQPAINFGQAWPTLVFMPYMAFIDTTQRSQLFGARGGTDTFWEYVGPHEVAHQWWGHIIGWTSYHDQWMSEGFAEFSTSLYVQFVAKDFNKFKRFWENQRKLIVEASPSTLGKKPYTVGPVTQGYRLNSARTGNVARRMIYPKGAYILHMVRMMMYQAGTSDPDAAFKQMMKDFVQSNFNRDITTDDFKRAVEKHIQPQMDIDNNKSMNWFFDEWVYGWEMPSYNFTYRIENSGGQTKLVGKITQSGVSQNFAMLVPIYLDYGKGWKRLGTVRMVGSSSIDINVPLPQAAQSASICALNDVLADKIENVKQ